jgi:polyisoprenyl-phosphate glycosyltransferase
VDDHSRDGTFAVTEELALRDVRVRGVRLSRNSGSHVAITCGLHQATGDAAAMMAADLQDPPETLGAMLDRWRQGAQVVWAVRRTLGGHRGEVGLFPRIYYIVMRHLVGMKEMPATGADFFLIDRAVIDAYRQFPERHVSVLALITWMGFRQDYVEYDKQRRTAGRSGWTFGKKVRLFVDSVTSFSDFPIRACSYVGAGLMAIALVIAAGGLALLPSLGAGLLLVLAVVVGLSGVQLLALGVVGAYIWRGLDEARRRPLYLIEAVAGRMAASAYSTPEAR